eukprot:scaffold13802_cov116-Isochrysis_galbana.AAC.2
MAAVSRSLAGGAEARAPEDLAMLRRVEAGLGQATRLPRGRGVPAGVQTHHDGCPHSQPGAHRRAQEGKEKHAKRTAAPLEPRLGGAGREAEARPPRVSGVHRRCGGQPVQRAEAGGADHQHVSGGQLGAVREYDRLGREGGEHKSGAEARGQRIGEKPGAPAHHRRIGLAVAVDDDAVRKKQVHCTS